MITAIAWKNVWRNKTRSFVVIIAVTLGTIAGVFVAGLMNGWLNQRINSSIYTEVGHIKIQNPDFLINEEITYDLKNYTEVVSVLDTLSQIKAFAARSKVVAMASTARGNTGIMLKGINPDKEKQVSDVHQQLVEGGGNYFDSKTRIPPVVISRKTAEQLRILKFRITQAVYDSLGTLEVPHETLSKLQPLVSKRFTTKKKFEKAIEALWLPNEIKKYAPILIAQSAYYQRNARINFSFTKVGGNIAYQTFQVVGIFKTSNTAFDQMSAFVHQEQLAAVSGLENNQVHEVSIILNDAKDMDAVLAKLKKQFPNNSVMGWKELAPDAGMMADFMQVYYYIIMGIIFFALAFGIINTMLMAILERVKELGMLMAIGMKKRKVFVMIVLETIFLTLSGSILGMFLGGALIRITNKTGLNFSSVAEGFEAMGWAAIVYPEIELSFFFGITLMIIVIAILASIVPARKALSIKPIEALRTA